MAIRVVRTRYERKTFFVELSQNDGCIVSDTYLNDMKERIYNISRCLEKVVLVCHSVETEEPDMQQLVERIRRMCHRPIEIKGA